MKWMLLSFLFCFASGLSSKALARVDLKSTKPLIIPVDTVTPHITEKDVAEVIPTDVTAADSTGSVITRIADRGIQYWYNNSGFKNSALGRVAEDAQEKLKTDVVVPASSSGGVTHKFSFKIEAFQALAKMEYTGWLKAVIDYNARQAQTDFSISEKIWNNKDFVMTHSITAREGVSSMGVRWNF